MLHRRASHEDFYFFFTELYIQCHFLSLSVFATKKSDFAEKRSEPPEVVTFDSTTEKDDEKDESPYMDMKEGKSNICLVKRQEIVFPLIVIHGLYLCVFLICIYSYVIYLFTPYQCIYSKFKSNGGHVHYKQ